MSVFFNLPDGLKSSNPNKPFRHVDQLAMHYSEENDTLVILVCLGPRVYRYNIKNNLFFFEKTLVRPMHSPDSLISSPGSFDSAAPETPKKQLDITCRAVYSPKGRTKDGNKRRLNMVPGFFDSLFYCGQGNFVGQDVFCKNLKSNINDKNSVSDVNSQLCISQDLTLIDQGIVAVSYSYIERKWCIFLYQDQQASRLLLKIQSSSAPRLESFIENGYLSNIFTICTSTRIYVCRVNKNLKILGRLYNKNKISVCCLPIHYGTLLQEVVQTKLVLSGLVAITTGKGIFLWHYRKGRHTEMLCKDNVYLSCIFAHYILFATNSNLYLYDLNTKQKKNCNGIKLNGPIHKIDLSSDEKFIVFEYVLPEPNSTQQKYLFEVFSVDEIISNKAQGVKSPSPSLCDIQLSPIDSPLTTPRNSISSISIGSE